MVDDPFRWLEEDSDETRAWQAAQNRATDAYFGARKDLAALRARISELFEIGFCDTPFVAVSGAGKRAFYTRREGAAQQPKLVVRDGESERVVIDVAALSADATDALDWWYPSPSGARLAWGRSSAGSEKSVLAIRDLETGEDSERIDDTQHCTVAWTSEKAFFYTRHPPGDPYNSRVYFHELGRDPKDDPLVFPRAGDERDKTDAPQPIASPCGRFLIVVVQQGWSKCEVWYRDLRDPNGAFVPLQTGEEATFEVIARRDAFYVLTNSGAPRYRLLRGDWEKPARENWREVLGETNDVLSSVAIAGDRIVCSYLRDASSVIVVRDARGDREVSLPAIGSASVTASPDDDDVYVAFTSFVVPLGAWKLDGDALVPFARVASAPSTEGIVVERRFATSHDGTRIPIFVIRREDTALPARTVLYGYGGFNVNQTPAFSARALTFVTRGGVWATAVLRGGGEYGEAWHRAGMLANKQNVFDDFYACAEDLVRSGVARSNALGALGGSNGGLLVSAAVTQRPELFAAAIAAVPLTDMLRYHLFRLGAFWISEYGSPDEADAFHVLYKYSPLHHVTRARYPAMLFWTAESDSRVDPMHARKMAAAMQAATTGRAPVLLRVETKAGHGMGKPTSKLADQVACELAFFEAELGPTLGKDEGAKP